MTECPMRPPWTRDSDPAMPANQQTSSFADLPLLFALFALLVGEVLLRDVERAVLPLNVAAREVLADHAKHGELQAAEQQNQARERREARYVGAPQRVFEDDPQKLDEPSERGDEPDPDGDLQRPGREA